MDDETTPGQGEDKNDKPAANDETVVAAADKPDAVKALLGELRTEIKSLKADRDEARGKLQEIEDAGKSDLEKLETRATNAESKIPGLEAKLLQYEVAAAKKLDLSLATRLTGSTRDEMEADADGLLKLLGNQTPAPDFDSGVRTTAPEADKRTPEQKHGDALKELFSGRQPEGWEPSAGSPLAGLQPAG